MIKRVLVLLIALNVMGAKTFAQTCDGMKTTYTLDVAATTSANTIAVNGGNLNLVYKLTSGTAIPSIGNSFNLPVTYSDFSNTAMPGTDNRWEGLGTFATAGVNYFVLLPQVTKGATGSLYNNLPANNKQLEPQLANASGNVDAFFSTYVPNNYIDKLGTLNLSFGGYPTPAGITIDNATLLTRSIGNMLESSANPGYIKNGYWIKPTTQTTTTVGTNTSITPEFSLNYNSNYEYSYSALDDGQNTSLADNAGLRGLGLYGSVTYCTQLTLKGTIYNDVNGLTDNAINGTGTGTPSGYQLYANLLDATGTTVIATVSVNTDGTYTLPVSPNTSYQVQISIVQGTVGSAKPATSLPTGWANTGDIVTGETATATTQGVTSTIAVATTNVTGANFGIEQLPETAVHILPAILNPGGSNFVTIPASSFATSNVGSYANTQDYDGGTIAAIKLTSFPVNITAIKINDVTYTTLSAINTAYPNGIPTDVSGNPTLSIAVDPANTLGSIVINFSSVDNAGQQDPTPGKVTLPFNGALAVKLLDFSGVLKNSNCELHWITTNELDMAKYEIEISNNGFDFIKAGEVSAANVSFKKDYYFVYPTLMGNNYFRLKSLELNGKIEYSNIIVIKNNSNVAYTIHPNPATDGNIFISGLKGGELIHVIDNAGKIVLTDILPGNNIDLSKMPKGLYHLQIIDSKQKVTVLKMILL